jgi:hypothetical protein
MVFSVAREQKYPEVYLQPVSHPSILGFMLSTLNSFRLNALFYLGLSAGVRCFDSPHLWKHVSSRHNLLHESCTLSSNEIGVEVVKSMQALLLPLGHVAEARGRLTMEERETIDIFNRNRAAVVYITNLAVRYQFFIPALQPVHTLS